MKYTLVDSENVKKILDETLSSITKSIESLPCANAIESVILGGGYGRGEGGVFTDHDGIEKPYNDLDFFVFMTEDASSDTAKEIDSALENISKEYSVKLGIDVDFAPCRKPSSLGKVKNTLMFMDLKAGHKMIFGKKNTLDILPESDFEKIPRSEGARLMMNRAAGLLLAYEKIQDGVFNDESSSFIIRNMMKAILTCGDALLINTSKYVPDVRERLNTLKMEPSLDFIVPFYESALEFKERPELSVPELFEGKWNVAARLWRRVLFFMCDDATESQNACENRRIILKNCLSREGVFLRNAALNMNAFRKKIWTGCLFKHPRTLILADLYSEILEKTEEKVYISKYFYFFRSSWKKRWKRFN